MAAFSFYMKIPAITFIASVTAGILLFIFCQKFVCRNVKSFGNIEQRIKRYSPVHIGRFHCSDECEIFFNLFSELLLRKSAELAVVA